MPPDTLPDTLIGLAALVIVTVSTLVTARITARQRAIGSDVTAVRGQVENGHAEVNLREQLDTMQQQIASLGTATAAVEQKITRLHGATRDTLDDVQRDIRGIRQDVGGIRGELRDERTARSAADREMERRVVRLEHPDRT